MVVSHCNVWLLKGNSTDPGNAAEALSQPAAGVSSLRVLAGQNGGLPWMFLNTTRKPPNIALDDDLSCQSLFKRLHLLGKMSNHWFECTLLPYQNFSDKSTSKKIFGCHVRFPEATTFTFQHVHAYTGWWFQTFFIFHNIWDNPSRWLIFFKMVKTTNQETIGYWGTKISDIAISVACGSRIGSFIIFIMELEELDLRVAQLRGIAMAIQTYHEEYSGICYPSLWVELHLSHRLIFGYMVSPHQCGILGSIHYICMSLLYSSG